MTYDNFLFDFDGTLINSSFLHEKAFLMALPEHQDQPNFFDYSKYLGIPTPDVFRMLGYDDPVEIENLTRLKRNYYAALVSSGDLSLYEGALKLLQSLKKKKKNIYMVTGGGAISVKKALQHTKLHEYFSGIITADDVSKGKPSPDPYLCCLRKFDLEADRSLVIEDSFAGIQSAKTAGLVVVGVHNPEIAGTGDFWCSNLENLFVKLKDE